MKLKLPIILCLFIIPMTCRAWEKSDRSTLLQGLEAGVKAGFNQWNENFQRQKDERVQECHNSCRSDLDDLRINCSSVSSIRREECEARAQRYFNDCSSDCY